ncbi:sigma 54-interacting transcriptional regulator, partial [Thermodesulfobacteriota bacterium]
MIRITILHQENYDVRDIITIFRNENIDILTYPLSNIEFAQDDSTSNGLYLLLIPNAAVATIAEWSHRVCKVFGQQIDLISCADVYSYSDRKMLFDCGTKTVLVPASWANKDIVDRVLGELILRKIIQPTTFGRLRGATKVMQDVYSDIKILAPYNSPILIRGEAGTGKELVALEVHDRSGRPGPCHPKNCAELTREFASSDLFGHKKGSFTGATNDRKGFFKEAEPGTAFLDEFGELDRPLQARLLRVLVEHQVQQIGDDKYSPINIRVVLAT